MTEWRLADTLEKAVFIWSNRRTSTSGVRKIQSPFFLPLVDAALALTASRERFTYLTNRTNFLDFCITLQSVADLSRASDDDLQTKCEVLELALTANCCEGIKGQQRLREKVDALDLQWELRSPSRLVNDDYGLLHVLRYSVSTGLVDLFCNVIYICSTPHICLSP